MPTHHIASWLLKHSDVPLAVLKPVATKLGVSTNHLGAALFAGQLVYENQGTIVEYADRGGVTVGEFLRDKSADRYGDDHPLTEYFGANAEALAEAFEGTEEEVTTFAEFYRRLRAVDRDAPDLAPTGLLSGVSGGLEGVKGAMPDPRDAVSGAADDGESDSVEIPVRDKRNK